MLMPVDRYQCHQEHEQLFQSNPWARFAFNTVDFSTRKEKDHVEGLGIWPEMSQTTINLQTASSKAQQAGEETLPHVLVR